MHAVHVAREQIHHRRREQAEVAGVERILQAALGAIERNVDLELIALEAGAKPVQVVQGEEQESVGEGEIFLQQPIAVEAGAGDGQQRLAVIEADLGNGAGGAEVYAAPVSVERT